MVKSGMGDEEGGILKVFQGQLGCMLFLEYRRYLQTVRESFRYLSFRLLYRCLPWCPCFSSSLPD